MEEEIKYLDYDGLQLYDRNIKAIIETIEQVTSLALNDLNDNKISRSDIWIGTQVEYDAITDKDPNTIYIIKSTS